MEQINSCRLTILAWTKASSYHSPRHKMWEHICQHCEQWNSYRWSRISVDIEVSLHNKCSWNTWIHGTWDLRRKIRDISGYLCIWNVLAWNGDTTNSLLRMLFCRTGLQKSKPIFTFIVNHTSWTFRWLKAYTRNAFT